MRRRNLALLGAILFLVGVVAILIAPWVVSYGVDGFPFLFLLAPMSLVGTVGFFLLFFAWIMPSEKLCAACGAGNPKTSGYCGRCGQPLPGAESPH